MNSKKQDNHLRFDVEFDIDKEKKEILVEKAKYILPILQKLGQRLPTYVTDIAKKSLTTNEYFQNMRQFWSEIIDESIIASHDSPAAYKRYLDALKQKADEILKKENEEQEKMRLAELEAQRIRDDYKKKMLIEDAHDFIRQNELLQKEKKQNISNKEWQQFNIWFSHQFTKVGDVYDSTLGGIGQLLDSTLSIPANLIVNFTSTQVLQIGKLLVLVAGVVIIGLMTVFLVKLFIRKVLGIWQGIGAVYEK
jgi:hypothetical protein